MRLTLHEGRLGGPVVARFSFPRDAPELEQLRVGAVVELKGQRWRVLDSLVGGASGFIVIERIR